MSQLLLRDATKAPELFEKEHEGVPEPRRKCLC
ncbi:MAG: hypothetical protein PUK29_10345 [Fibrobacter sp.]|nr:hypothetical protein [Fibrobacter sp.]MCI6437181.1 hypothetical protein [Fibrobacter sp.]MDD7498643.1 hypothetical protein [Fibrobacter sp.]